jgi:hypothetical protein
MIISIKTKPYKPNIKMIVASSHRLLSVTLGELHRMCCHRLIADQSSDKSIIQQQPVFLSDDCST